MIRRNTNRRQIIGDHHRPAAGGATLLVRAWNEILGTHSRLRWPPVPGCGPDRRAGLWPSGPGRGEEEAFFKISLMRRGALKRVRWLVNAVYVAERIAHFTDSRTGAERLTHGVEEVAVTRGRLLQCI